MTSSDDMLAAAARRWQETGRTRKSRRAWKKLLREVPHSDLAPAARAALDGRPVADIADLESVALSTLRHRVVGNFAAEAAGRSSEELCRELISSSDWRGAA